jgi:hypothetical protein
MSGQAQFWLISLPYPNFDPMIYLHLAEYMALSNVIDVTIKL